MALEQIAARTPSGQVRDAARGQDAEKLLRAPVRMGSPQSEQLLHHRQWSRRRACVRPPRAIDQARWAVDLEPRHPLVPNPSADTVACAEFAERHEPPVVVTDEALPLVHG